MKRKTMFLTAVALSVLVGAAFASNAPPSSPVSKPGPSATVGPLTIVSSVTLPGLENSVVAKIDVTGVTADSGGNDIVCGVIFDDGFVKASTCAEVPVGQTQPVTFALNWTGPILTGAPGFGVYIIDATSLSTPSVGATLASLDPAFTSAGTIPTLTPGMIAALAVLLLGAGIWMQRRRKA
jgi:hypothetical protein